MLVFIYHEQIKLTEIIHRNSKVYVNVEIDLQDRNKLVSDKKIITFELNILYTVYDMPQLNYVFFSSAPGQWICQ